MLNTSSSVRGVPFAASCCESNVTSGGIGTTTSWSSASAASLPNSRASQLIRPSVGETVALSAMPNVRNGGRLLPFATGTKRQIFTTRRFIKVSPSIWRSWQPNVCSRRSCRLQFPSLVLAHSLNLSSASASSLTWCSALILLGHSRHALLPSRIPPLSGVPYSGRLSPAQVIAANEPRAKAHRLCESGAQRAQTRFAC